MLALRVCLRVCLSLLLVLGEAEAEVQSCLVPEVQGGGLPQPSEVFLTLLQLCEELVREGREEGEERALEQLAEEFEREVRRVQLLAVAGQLDAAAHLGEKILKYFPDDYLLNLELGVIYFLRQDHETALCLCQNALALQTSEDSQAYSCVGVVATHLGHEEIGLQALYRAYSRREVPVVIKSKIFSIPRKAIEGSLIHSLNIFGRNSECVNVAAELLSLPVSPMWRSYLSMFSTVNWKNLKKIYLIEQLEKNLHVRNVLVQLNKSVSFLAEINRLQMEFNHILNSLSYCIRSSTSQYALEALNALYHIAHEDHNELHNIDQYGVRNQVFANDSQTHQSKRANGNIRDGIVLVTQHYVDNSSGNDVLVALMRNLMNPYISNIILFNDEQFDFSKLPNSYKIHQIVSSNKDQSRLLFKDALSFASKEFQDRVVILANSDIYFDQSLSSMGDLNGFPPGLFFAMSKWKDWWQSSDITSTYFDVRSDSQDAWIFRTPLDNCVLEKTNFPMGEVGCDNRLAVVLKSCGYDVTNPALFLRAMEYSSKYRLSTLYSSAGGNSGDGMGKSNVFLTDSPPSVYFSQYR